MFYYHMLDIVIISIGIGLCLLFETLVFDREISRIKQKSFSLSLSRSYSNNFSFLSQFVCSRDWLWRRWGFGMLVDRNEFLQLKLQCVQLLSLARSDLLQLL